MEPLNRIGLTVTDSQALKIAEEIAERRKVWKRGAGAFLPDGSILHVWERSGEYVSVKTNRHGVGPLMWSNDVPAQLCALLRNEQEILAAFGA